MRWLRITEGNAADEFALRRQAEISTDEIRIGSERRLGNRRHTNILRRQHEIRDIQSAIHRAIDAEFFLRGNQRNMGRAEKTEILQRLPRGRGLVLAADAQCLIELYAADLAPLSIDALVAQRKREVGFRGCAVGRMRIQRPAKPLDRLAGNHQHLPGLAVAPRRGLLRDLQYALDDRARYRRCLILPAAVALPDNPLEFHPL